MKYTKGQSKGKDMLAFWPNALEAVNQQLVNASDSLPECVLRYSYRPKDGWALVDVSNHKNIADYTGEIINIQEVLNVVQMCILQGWSVPLIKDTLYVSQERKLKVIALPYLEQAPGSIDDLKAILSSRDDFDCFKADSDADLHQFEANGKRAGKNANTANSYSMDFFGRNMGSFSNGAMAVDFFGRPVDSAPQEDVIDFWGSVKEKTPKGNAGNSSSDGFMDAFFGGNDDAEPITNTSDDDAFFGFGNNDIFSFNPVMEEKKKEPSRDQQQNQPFPLENNSMDAFFNFDAVAQEKKEKPVQIGADQAQNQNTGFQDPFTNAIAYTDASPKAPSNGENAFDFFTPTGTSWKTDEGSGSSFENLFSPTEEQAVVLPENTQKREPDSAHVDGGAFDFFSPNAYLSQNQTPEQTVRNDVESEFSKDAPKTIKNVNEENPSESFGFDFFGENFGAFDNEETTPSIDEKVDEMLTPQNEIVQKSVIEEHAEVAAEKSDDSSNNSFEGFDFFGSWASDAAEVPDEKADTAEEIVSNERKWETSDTVAEDIPAPEAEIIKQAAEEPDTAVDFFGNMISIEEEPDEEELQRPEQEKSEDPAVETEADAGSEDTTVDFFGNMISIKEVTTEEEPQQSEEEKIEEAEDEMDATIAAEDSEADFFGSWDFAEEEAVAEEPQQPEEEKVVETEDKMDATIAAEDSEADFFGSWDFAEEEAVAEEPQQPEEEKAEEAEDEMDATIAVEDSVADFFGNWDSAEEETAAEELQQPEEEKAEEAEDKMDATIAAEDSEADFFGNWDSAEEEAVAEEPQQPEEEKAEEAEDEMDATIVAEDSAADFFGNWDSAEEETVAEESQQPEEEKVVEAEDEMDATIAAEDSAADFFGNWDSAEEETAAEELQQPEEEKAEEVEDEMDATIAAEDSAADFFGSWDSAEEEAVAEEPQQEEEKVEEAEDEIDETIAAEASALDFFGDWDSSEEETVAEESQQQEEEKIAEAADEMEETIASADGFADFVSNWDSEEKTDEEAQEPEAEKTEEAEDELDATIASEVSDANFFGNWDSVSDEDFFNSGSSAEDEVAEEIVISETEDQDKEEKTESASDEAAFAVEEDVCYDSDEELNPNEESEALSYKESLNDEASSDEENQAESTEESSQIAAKETETLESAAVNYENETDLPETEEDGGFDFFEALGFYDETQDGEQTFTENEQGEFADDLSDTIEPEFDPDMNEKTIAVDLGDRKSVLGDLFDRIASFVPNMVKEDGADETITPDTKKTFDAGEVSDTETEETVDSENDAEDSFDLLSLFDYEATEDETPAEEESTMEENVQPEPEKTSIFNRLSKLIQSEIIDRNDRTIGAEGFNVPASEVTATDIQSTDSQSEEENEDDEEDDGFFDMWNFDSDDSEGEQ